MKLNIANPTTGSQRVFEVDDEKKLRALYDKRMGQEVSGDDLGEEFKGYVFRITGGCDKQGFAMKQGVLVPGRVRLLLSGKNTSCFTPKRNGERKRKSVHGCFIGTDIAVVAMVVATPGPAPIPGLTDVTVPKPLGPKRATKIRKLFDLKKTDDVRKFVVRRVKKTKAGKERSVAPKITRLITPEKEHRKKHRKALVKRAQEKSKTAAQEYQKLLQQRRKERRQSDIAEKRASRLSATKPAAAPPAAAAAAKPVASAAGAGAGKKGGKA